MYYIIAYRKDTKSYITFKVHPDMLEAFIDNLSAKSIDYSIAAEIVSDADITIRFMSDIHDFNFMF